MTTRYKGLCIEKLGLYYTLENTVLRIIKRVMNYIIKLETLLRYIFT